jgi:hypothetical protein
LAELELFKWPIQKQTVIVIRGQIFRQSCDDGQTAFIINECPRLVLNEVTSMIGKPIPLLKACELHKYSDYHLKYASDDFAIPFKAEFRQKFFKSLHLSSNSNSRQPSELNLNDDDDNDELQNIPYPTNVNRSEELEAKVVGQPDEKFKNKKQVLFGGLMTKKNS